MIKIQNANGTVQISGDVFMSLTSEAATGCFGVKGMVVRSMTDGLFHLLKRESMAKGVHVSYNDDGSISLELHIAVDSGVNIPVICGSIIREVRYKIEDATAVPVANIDIFVDSMIVG